MEVFVFVVKEGDTGHCIKGTVLSPVCLDWILLFTLLSMNVGSFLFTLCLLVNDFLQWSSYGGSVVMNPAGVYEDVGSIPGLAQCGKDPVLP